MSPTEIKTAYEKYQKEPTVQNKMAVREALKALDREIMYKEMTREELEEELHGLIEFQKATRKLQTNSQEELLAKEERLCIILNTINYISNRLLNFKGVKA